MTAHIDYSWMGPAPCDDCALSHRCAAERLACEAFARYAQLRRWRNVARNPSAEIFFKVFTTSSRFDEEALRQRRERHAATCAARGVKAGGRSSVSVEAPC